jgi:hypothetical protein
MPTYYRYEQFARPEHVLYVAAFSDLDGNGTLGSGEPFGKSGPIVDAPYGDSSVPPTSISITIDRTAP